MCSDTTDRRHAEEDYRGVAIIDAGGGTIDFSMYSVAFSPSVTAKEIVPAECKFYTFIGHA